MSTKRAAKSSLTKYDLTAVSLVWTIFQTRHTTNNIESLYTISLDFSSLLPSFSITIRWFLEVALINNSQVKLLGGRQTSKRLQQKGASN